MIEIIQAENGKRRLLNPTDTQRILFNRYLFNSAYVTKPVMESGIC